MRETEAPPDLLRLVGFRTCVRQDDAEHQFRIQAIQRELEVAAHGESDEQRLLDAETGQQFPDVLRMLLHAVAPIGRVGFAQPPQVDRNSSEPPAEHGRLLGPHGAIQREGVQKDDRRTAALVVIGDGHSIDLGLHRDCFVASVRPSVKAAREIALPLMGRIEF